MFGYPSKTTLSEMFKGKEKCVGWLYKTFLFPFFSFFHSVIFRLNGFHWYFTYLISFFCEWPVLYKIFIHIQLSSPGLLCLVLLNCLLPLFPCTFLAVTSTFELAFSFPLTFIANQTISND